MEIILGIGPFLKEFKNQREIIYAVIIPIKGAIKINPMVLSTGSFQFTECMPACAIAAPANPPINVCEEDEGIPSHHVNRFHKIDAISPEQTTGSVINSCLTVLATLLATP